MLGWMSLVLSELSLMGVAEPLWMIIEPAFEMLLVPRFSESLRFELGPLSTINRAYLGLALRPHFSRECS